MEGGAGAVDATTDDPHFDLFHDLADVGRILLSASGIEIPPCGAGAPARVSAVGGARSTDID